MARAAANGRARKRKDVSDSPTVSGVLVQECVGVALLGFAGLAAIALYTYHPADPVFEEGWVRNRGGALGAAVAWSLVSSVGYGATLLVAHLRPRHGLAPRDAVVASF